MFAHTWPQICIECIHIVTAVDISANWYKSNHFFVANTTPEHGDIFRLLLPLKTFEIPDFVKPSPNVALTFLSCPITI